jgi:hypothetical protein
MLTMHKAKRMECQRSRNSCTLHKIEVFLAANIYAIMLEVVVVVGGIYDTVRKETNERVNIYFLQPVY